MLFDIQCCLKFNAVWGLRQTQAHLQPLLFRASVQQFLDEVVAEGIHHELNEVVQHLREHQGNGSSTALVKLAL